MWTLIQDILKTDDVFCVVCGVGEVKPVTRIDEKESFVIYGRNGVRTAIHVESRCNNRNKYADCRAGYYHGYITHKGLTVFEDDAMMQEVLVTSNQTGFEIEYMLEVKDRVQISNVTFEAEAKAYVQQTSQQKSSF